MSESVGHLTRVVLVVILDATVGVPRFFLTATFSRFFGGERRCQRGIACTTLHFFRAARRLKFRSYLAGR